MSKRSAILYLTLPASKGIRWRWSFVKVHDHNGHVYGSSWHLSGAWTASQSHVKGPFQAVVDFYLAESSGKSRDFAWHRRLYCGTDLPQTSTRSRSAKLTFDLPVKRRRLRSPDAWRPLRCSLPPTKVQWDQLEIIPIQWHRQTGQDQLPYFCALLLLLLRAGCTSDRSQNSLSRAQRRVTWLGCPGCPLSRRSLATTIRHTKKTGSPFPSRITNAT